MLGPSTSDWGAGQAPWGHPPRYRRQLQPPWRALRGLIDARVRLEQWARSPLTADRAACADLDRRVEAMLAVLADAHRAVEDARATTLGMDDRALRAAEWLRDSLVDAARALHEADAAGAPILVESAEPGRCAPGPGDQPETPPVAGQETPALGAPRATAWPSVPTTP